MDFPTTRKQKWTLKWSEKRERQLREAEEMKKRFREFSATGPNDDVHIQPIFVGKVEIKEEVDCESDETEELEGISTENEEEKGISENAPNQADKGSVKHLMDEIFNSEDVDMVKIRGKIVGHVIRSEIGRGSSRNDLCSMRLVAKSWLQDAHKILLQIGEPFYKIMLHDKRGGQFLEEFTKIVTTSTSYRWETPMFPISLGIRSGFFQMGYLKSLFNFMAFHGSVLIQIYLEIPKNGDSMTLQVPGVNLTFPQVQKLSIQFSDKVLDLNEKGKHLSLKSNSVAIPFINWIINGAEKLNGLCLTSGSLEFTTLDGLSSVAPTITSANLTSWQLEGLLQLDIPNLRILKLSISEVPYVKGVVSQIMKKFSTSLRELRFVTSGHPLPPIFIRSPRMESLESFSVFSSVELEEGHPPLQNFIPNLKKLVLKYQTQANTQKWVNSSIFPNVHTFRLRLAPMDYTNYGYHFPNLSSLTLELSVPLRPENLKQIFEIMCQLKRLNVKISLVPRVSNSDIWDSPLTGIPIEKVGGIRETPELWPHIQLENHYQASIVNLKELERLDLGHHVNPIGRGSKESLISDLTFKFAFLKMPNLTKLFLEGDFKVSAEMARVWRDLGKLLVNNS